MTVVQSIRHDDASASHDQTERRGRGATSPPNIALYRSDLDVLILDSDGIVAAYGLFWYDAVTATGLVEPMRTEDDHQRRGLARHLLTAGIDLLAGSGASRIKICFERDNPAAGGSLSQCRVRAGQGDRGLLSRGPVCVSMRIARP